MAREMFTTRARQEGKTLRSEIPGSLPWVIADRSRLMQVLANLVGGGFRGVVYPVNADSEAVLGVPCYPDVAHLPGKADLAIICSPAEEVPRRVAASMSAHRPIAMHAYEMTG